MLKTFFPTLPSSTVISLSESFSLLSNSHNASNIPEKDFSFCPEDEHLGKDNNRNEEELNYGYSHIREEGKSPFA